MMNNADVNNPRVLILSHNCLSKGGSNGRTLANFFVNWPKESIAQFYIINELPDSDICTNYFRVTDIEALKSYFIKMKVGSQIDLQHIEAEDCPIDGKVSKLYNRSRKKTPLNYIVRNFIWNSNKWKNEKFTTWVNEFNPSVLFLQLGDFAFMIRIAMDIAMERNIPIVIYNCEDHYFREKKSLSPLYKYYRADFENQVEKLFNYSSFSIYNSDVLKETFQKQFRIDSEVVMTSTDIAPIENKKTNSSVIVSYMGNLGVGRHEPLIEIAEEMHKLDANVYLDIYGKSRDEDVEKALRACVGIRFKGFVSYDVVADAMRKSDLLVHAENFSASYQRELKHAFSTKISDCLGSGTCLFVYAPESMAFTKYLLENEAAYVVTDKSNLKEALRIILTDDELRQSVADNALKVAHYNHNINVNAQKIRKIIHQIAGNR